MALKTLGENGAVRDLDASAVAVGVGVSHLGKTLEVAGNIISRTSSEAGGRAVGLASEGDVHGSIWTNASYDPSNPGSGWKRTINLVNGNVGIGGSKDDVAKAPPERLVVAGNILATGDVRLAGADCAEEFDIVEQLSLEPGTVVVMAGDDDVRICDVEYDTKVVGVISGAGGHPPGVILGRRYSDNPRLPVALAGTVWCKVDAHKSPICVGDLLTTSCTPGHAMKVSEPIRALGAVIGKAMRPLDVGLGLIPILVTLR